MLDGHFDYGNGYHGRVYLNPHQLFRHPSTIWRFAQDLLDVLPGELRRSSVEVVAGPVTGGALLAHTIAGLLDSRRSLTHPPCSFRAVQLRSVGGLHAAQLLSARARRQAGAAGRRCAEYRGDVRALRGAGARGGRRRSSRRSRSTIGCEAIVDLGVPNIALAEYKAPENYKAATVRCAKRALPITRF